LKENGGLMLILGYLLRGSIPRSGAQVDPKIMSEDPNAKEDTRENLLDIASTIRMGARVDVIVSKGREFSTVLHETSQDADLNMMGMAEPGDQFDEYFKSQHRMIADLPTTVLVLAGEEISFGEVLIRKDTMS
jgi:hypothetical protein